MHLCLLSVTTALPLCDTCPNRYCRISEVRQKDVGFPLFSAKYFHSLKECVVWQHQEVLDKEREIELGKEDLQGKPEEVREKMVEGRLKKYSKTLSLMDQPYVKDNDKTVGDALREAVASIGENIQVISYFVCVTNLL